MKLRSAHRAEVRGACARRQVLSHLAAAAARDGFALDAAQVDASEYLADAACSAMRCDTHRSDGRGAYVWGAVGRGKTWLLDAFFQAVPTSRKRRVHFQRFFRDFHAATHRHGVGPKATQAALDDLFGGIDLVCFDEFYAHNPGDARLLTRLLRDLLEERSVVVVATSNYEPDGLMPDAEYAARGGEQPVHVRHAVFEPGIALIKRHLDVVPLDAGVDYRLTGGGRRTGFRAGAYVTPGTLAQFEELGIAAASATPYTVACGGGRTIEARRTRDRTLWFRFHALCERPVGPSDILAIADGHRNWLISDIPPLASCSPHAAQRFVNTIDVLHDTDTTLFLSSACAPDELWTGRIVPPDAARAMSRLALLGRT